MVYLPPPHLTSASKPSYAEAYNDILAAHRRSPLTSASSVIILVAPDVDALCASRMLADLLKQDDVMHKIWPVSGMQHLNRIIDKLRHYPELHTLILLNMGSIHDLPAWFSDFNDNLKVHVIDSHRPCHLGSLFGRRSRDQRVVLWGDGDAERLEDPKAAFQAIEFVDEPPEDDDSESESEPENWLRSEDEDGKEYGSDEEEGISGKRRHINREQRQRKRRRFEDDPNEPPRMSRPEYEAHRARIDKHYNSGTSHGQSTTSTVYILATVLERADNDLLWLAILGLTYQYLTSRISRNDYDKYHDLYHDEVARLNPQATTTAGSLGLVAHNSLHPDDSSVRSSEELRFTLFRHWALYDAMYHSSYVASKLGIWKERGRKKLSGLLAKMGFSIMQTQQTYSHMDMDLKKLLRSKLDAIAPEYGMVELLYPSFVRCFGYRSSPLSAADAVEAISVLLEVAGGTRMEVEVEGARNGGEWFGGGRLWDEGDSGGRWEDDERENIPPGQETVLPRNQKAGHQPALHKDGVVDEDKTELRWWLRNFWTAYDALSDITRLREALQLSMSLHRAIIRQGSSIIDKQDIRTMRGHRVVVLSQGPDLALFVHPGVLSRLALWLVDALRERVPATATTNGRSKKKSLPFVVACLNEVAGTYTVVGITAAPDFDDVRKNEFSSAFIVAKESCKARAGFTTFESSVMEIRKDDLQMFLKTLCEVNGRY